MRSFWRSEVLRRLRAARLDPATEQEVAEELAQHLDDRYRELLASGLTESEARRTALRELEDKGLGRSIGELKSEPARTHSNLLLDLRFALRMMRRAPGFTAVAAATMAVCIGATVALFSVVDTLLLRPLDYPRADRLVRVHEHIVDANLLRNQVSGPNFLDWKRESTAFDGIAAYRRRNVNASAYGAAAGAGEPRYVRAARASVEFFGVLGVSPALGRAFTIEEDRQVAHVTVVSHAFWMSHMAGDPGVLGTSLDFDGEPYVVIGVLPENFRFHLETEAWIPLGLYPGTRAGRGAHSLGVVARLKEGASVSRAQAELESIAKRLSREYPDTNARCGVFVEPLQASLVHDTRAAVLTLMAAVAFVLLIACANIGGLLVARSAARAREFAVRVALGASRARLARQLVVESLAVAALGGSLGTGLAALSVAALRRTEVVAVPRLDEIVMDTRVLAATVGITVLTGLLFGTVPALHISRRTGGALTPRGASSGRDERRVQSALTVWQVAFALVLLVGAGLMVRTLVRVQEVDRGFQARGILAVDLTLSDARYPKNEDAARFYRSVVETVAALPGVQRAALVSDLPLSGGAGHYSIGFQIAGAPARRAGEEDFAYLRWVTPEYFNAIGVPLLSGRLFTEGDAIGEPPVAIINAAMAARHFPNQDPIGRELVIRSGDSDPKRIVGVVADLHQTTLTDAPAPQMYTPFYQAPAGWGTLLIKTAGDPRLFSSAVQRAVRGVDPQQPIFNVRTLEDAVDASIAPQKLTMRVLVAFAFAALALVALGIYGVVAFQVTRRTREIAVRLALGARPADVLWIVARRGLAPVALGMLLGLGGAVALTRSLRGLLFEVEPLDALSFSAAASLLVAVTLLACLLPARRALRTEPAVALTNE